jgi:PAS domain S-box-containing protein
MNQALKNTTALPQTTAPHDLHDHPLHVSKGFLLLSHDLCVVEFDEGFQDFHHLFNEVPIAVGQSTDPSFFSKYSPGFATNLSTLLSGKEENIIFQFEHLLISSPKFEVRINKLSDTSPGKGISIFIHEMETPAFMPMYPPTEEFFKLLVESSTDVYQLVDAALIVTYTSNAVEAMLGYASYQLLGRSVLDNIHPDDKDTVRDWLISIRSIKEKILSKEYRIKSATGDWIWIENNARNLLHHKDVKGIIMNFRNIQSKKIADHALVQTEQRLSLLLNNTEESFIILNSRLRIITYNRAAQEHSPFFFNQELQSGMSVLELVNKEDIPAYIQSFEKVFEGEELERETKFVDEEGKLHIFNHTYRPLFDKQKDIFGVFITSTNITERKKLTEELAANSERLETAQLIAKLAYFEYDFVSRAFFFSEQFYNILQIEEKEYDWTDLSFIENIIHPEDKDRVKTALETVFLHSTDFNIEFRIGGKDNNDNVILAIGAIEKDDSGNATTFRVTIQDITDSKMAILAIQTLESKFKSLFENSIDGVILSKWDGGIISANPSACNMLGYTSEEMISLNRWNLLEVSSPMVIEMMEQRQKTGSYMGELMFIHKKGYFVPAEVTSMSMTDGEGNNYISTIIRDITEKKKIEREQKALTEELLKNNQDLQQFSFITSHNLRAPVANLMSLLSLFNKQNPADEFNHVLIEKFEEATNQLNQTLNDLVNVLVIKSNNNIERESIHFSNVYADVKKNVESLLAQQNGHIEADFSAVDQIHYNRIHIESIFLNMISNAIRYRSSERTPDIKIRSYKKPGWVVVAFQDNGLGMDLKRYGDRLFGLYQRFHENKEGKGLGLYMTRSQVMAMGGKIEVESTPGVGTTFKIYFKS